MLCDTQISGNPKGRLVFKRFSMNVKSQKFHPLTTWRCRVILHPTRGIAPALLRQKPGSGRDWLFPPPHLRRRITIRCALPSAH
jgi:hypothetical protein